MKRQNFARGFSLIYSSSHLKKALVRASRRLLDSAPRRANINDNKFKKAKLAHLASAKFNIFIDVDFSVLLIKKQSLIIQVLFEKKSKFKQKKN